MRERSDDACRHQPFVARGQGASQVAQREDGHQREQHGLARQLAGGDRQQRRADSHAERIARDQQSGSGDGHMEVGGNLQQQAHDDEFGGADTKGTGGEGEEGDRHALNCADFGRL
jgi:hypothetical protein